MSFSAKSLSKKVNNNPSGEGKKGLIYLVGEAYLNKINFLLCFFEEKIFLNTNSSQAKGKWELNLLQKKKKKKSWTYTGKVTML